MRIGLTGTMSVGKTTLVKALQNIPLFKGYHFSTERSKYLNDLGIPLNTDSTVLGQLIFTAERSAELINNNLITDRTIWDVCSFTLSSKSIKRYHKEILINNIALLQNNYDYVFYISPEGIEMEDNGVREVDLDYRELIDNNIKRLLKTYPPERLYEIKGTTEERINQIINYIK